MIGRYHIWQYMYKKCCQCMAPRNIKAHQFTMVSPRAPVYSQSKVTPPLLSTDYTVLHMCVLLVPYLGAETGRIRVLVLDLKKRYFIPVALYQLWRTSCLSLSCQLIYLHSKYLIIRLALSPFLYGYWFCSALVSGACTEVLVSGGHFPLGIDP